MLKSLGCEWRDVARPVHVPVHVPVLVHVLVHVLVLGGGARREERPGSALRARVDAPKGAERVEHGHVYVHVYEDGHEHVYVHVYEDGHEHVYEDGDAQEPGSGFASTAGPR